MTAVWILAVLLLLPALFWLLARGIGHSRLYPRTRSFVEWEDGHRAVEDLVFFAKDGVKLHGHWYEHPEAKGVLLICHGNAGNVSHRLWMAEDLKDLPLHVLIFDYRGYGRSRGIPNEKGTALDVEAAWEVAHQRLGHPEDPAILLYGRSLGGGVALQLPRHCPVKGVILESTFSSILEMGLKYYPWLLPHWTLANRYLSLDRIQSLSVPVLVAHSPDDELVPFDMGQRLYDAAPAPWSFCTLQGLHDDAGWQTSEEYAAAFRAFARECLGIS